MPAGLILPCQGPMWICGAAIVRYLTAVTSPRCVHSHRIKSTLTQSSSVARDRCGFALVPAPGVVRCIQLPPTKGIVVVLCLKFGGLTAQLGNGKTGKKGKP